MYSFKKLFFESDLKKNHVKSLDGLRGMAVLLVLLSHSGLVGMFFHPFLDFRYTGTYGVYLFFVLSAFLLDRQICNAIKNNKANGRFWLNYFLRRILRIYPLFVFAILLNYYLTSKGYLDISINIYKEDIVPHLFLQLGKHIFWTIPVEFKYYFFSPIIVIVLMRYVGNRFFMSILFFIGLILVAFFATRYKIFPYFDTLNYFPLFLAGTFIALTVTYNNWRGNPLMDVILKKLNFIAIAAIILILLTFKVIFMLIWPSAPFIFHSGHLHCFYAVSWGIIVFAVLNNIPWLTKFFETKVLRFFGIISYSLYLLHIPVMYFISKTNLIKDQIKIYAFFIIVITISALTYLIIEKPCSKIRVKY